MLSTHAQPSHQRQVFIKGRSTTWKIVFLTLCLAGLQFTWTVEMAYGTPYLLSLGLTKAYMSLVWIAGPLSGLLMQPIVGILSDKCTLKWGRRRPFMLGGSIVVVASLFTIGWTRELASLLTGSQEGMMFKKTSIAIAIASIYTLDFAVNCVQASCRALIVDSLPSSQQEQGTAWAGRMVGLGNVAGYFMGYVNLVAIFPFFGNTQLKVLCVFASIALLACESVTFYAVNEGSSTQQTSRSSGSFHQTLKDIATHLWNLPPPIQRICNVQFFAWIGWFPFLFYSTTWVAEIYDQAALKHPETSIEDAVGQATRAGSLAFLIYSLVSLGSSFLFPWIVSSSLQETHSSTQQDRRTWRHKLNPGTLLQHLRMSFLTLPRAWTLSHLLFCAAMLSTFFVSTVASASVLIGLCGISWSITMWAPFSLLGEYIAHKEMTSSDLMVDSFEDQRCGDPAPLGLYSLAASSRLSLAAGGPGVGVEGGMYQLVRHYAPDTHMEEVLVEMVSLPPHPMPSQEHIPPSVSHAESPCTSLQNRNTFIVESVGPSIHNERREEPSAGVLLGIHNMYVVLPQFLVTFLGSILFSLMENTHGSKAQETSTNAIGVVLRFGAVMAGVAAYLSTHLHE